MPQILLTSNSISILAQLMMVLPILFYLFIGRKKSLETKLLIGFVSFAAIFLWFFFLQISISMPNPVHALYDQLGRVAILVFIIFLIQLAYHTPTPVLHVAREARVALVVTTIVLGVTVGLSIFSHYRSQIIGKEFIANLPLIFFVLEYLWLTTLFLRRSLWVSEETRPVSWFTKLLRPQGNPSVVSRNFAIISFMPLLTAIAFTQVDILASAEYLQLIVSTVIAIYIFLMLVLYISATIEPISLLVKLVAISLITILVLLSNAGTLIGPALGKAFVPQAPLADQQAVHFEPAYNGNGYSVRTVATGPAVESFDVMLAQRLQIGDEESILLKIGFPFPFYEQEWSEVYISDNGVLVFGEPFSLTKYDNHMQVAIAPLLTNLKPDLGGGLYVLQEPERLTIAWQEVPSTGTEHPNTFQAILYPDGAIDFIYEQIAWSRSYTSDPMHGIWLTGIAPGNATQLPVGYGLSKLAQQGTSSQPNSAVIDNVYDEFRIFFDQHIRPLAYLIFAAVGVVVLGFPIFFRFTLIQPLNALVDGVRRVNNGQFDLVLSPRLTDEIGFLTESFNQMTGSIQEREHALLELNKSLDARITARTNELYQAKEEAEAASRAKTTFLANMSHELRTPLNAVLGYAQIMQQKQRAGGIRDDSVDIIYQSGAHLLTMLNDILDLTKIEANKLDSRDTTVELLPYIQSIAKIVQLQAQSKGLRFGYETSNNLPTYIRCDERFLRQVLLNLLNNAVKFTDKGSVQLSVSAVEQRVNREDNGCRKLEGNVIENGVNPHVQREQTFANILFQVADTGIGIPEEEQQAAFLPFEQLGEQGSRAAGTGLGLTISQRLLHLLGGKLHLDSTVGQGSTFWFELELSVVKAPTEQELHIVTQTVAGYHGPQQRALVVDDDQRNRQVLTEMLTMIGFDVSTAANGLEAVEAAHNQLPALIMMDLVMTGMNGIEATRTIRQNPAFNNTVIIAVSANAFAEDQIQSLEAGCSAFLAKPIDRLRLNALLEEHLALSWYYQEDAKPPVIDAELSSNEVDSWDEYGNNTGWAGAHQSSSEEILLMLYEAALDGDMRSVRKLALCLEDVDQQLKPFTNKVTDLAKVYHEHAIISIIEEQMKT